MFDMANFDKSFQNIIIIATIAIVWYKTLTLWYETFGS